MMWSARVFAALVLCCAFILALGCAEPSARSAEAPDPVKLTSRERVFKVRSAPTDPTWLRTPPALWPVRGAAAPAVVERRLANGARVLIVERHDFPSVSLAFVLDRGTCDGGAAAALYAFAFGSSTAESRHESFSYLHWIGAPVQMSVSEDYLTLRSTVLPPLLSSAISRLAPMFFAPGLSSEDLTYARDIWRDKLSREGVRATRLAERALRESLFGRGAYGSVVVDASELAAEPDARVREFRRAALSPRHVSVVVVGDTTPDVVVQLLDQYTRGLPRDEVAPSGCAALPVPLRTAEIRIIDERGAEQSRVSIGAVGVPVGHADGPALDVLSSALGVSLSGRLNLKIREQHGLSYGVHMRSEQWRAHGLIEVTASVETERTAEAVKGLLSELDRAATEPLDEDELLGAKTKSFRDPGAHDEAAHLLAAVAAYGRSADEIALRWNAISNVTAQDLTRIATKYLAPEHRVVTVVGDAARIRASLGDLGIGRVVVEKR